MFADGQHMNRIGTKGSKTASGYITESARYMAQRCEGCPLRGSCFKARGNRIIEVNHRLNEYKMQAGEKLASEEGIKLRGRRCIEPEAVFGDPGKKVSCVKVKSRMPDGINDYLLKILMN